MRQLAGPRPPTNSHLILPSDTPKVVRVEAFPGKDLVTHPISHVLRQLIHATDPHIPLQPWSHLIDLYDKKASPKQETVAEWVQVVLGV